MEKAATILFTHEYPPFKGGIGNYAEGVARALVRSGRRVVLATPRLPGEQPVDCGSGDPEIVILPPSTGPKWFRVIRQAGAYRRVIENSPGSCIHCLDTESWRILGLLNLIENYCYSLTVHGSDVISTRSSMRFRLLGSRLFFKGVTSVSANSAFTRDLFLERFSNWEGPSISVAYPAPTEELSRLSRKAVSPRQRNRQSLRILTVARLDERKGHLFALSALQALADEIGQAFEWIVVGNPVDAWFHDRFQQAVKQASFKIIRKEELAMEELAEEYAKATLFLLTGEEHPKRVEGFGMVYLEAGLFGLPSIGTRVGGTAEAVVDGVTGLLSQPGDPSALVRNLKILITKKNLREQMGIAAREHALKFTWSNTADVIFRTEQRH